MTTFFPGQRVTSKRTGSIGRVERLAHGFVYVKFDEESGFWGFEPRELEAVGAVNSCFECGQPQPSSPAIANSLLECPHCNECPCTPCKLCGNYHFADDLNARGHCDPCADQHRKSARREAWLDEGNIR